MRDKKIHTGYTKARVRFNLRQTGKVPSINNIRPFKPVYYESSLDRSDTVDSEKYLKAGMGKRYLKNKLKRTLCLTG